jgi:tetratricopeptide (TPR) repeat protein
LAVVILSLAGMTDGYQAKASSAAQWKAPSSGDDLARLFDLERSSVQSGNVTAIITASQKTVAMALRQVAEWRLQEAAYPQAIVLCRDSLLLEDVLQAHAILDSAERQAKQQGIGIPEDLNGIDPAAPPDASLVARAKLTTVQVRDGKLREKRLRHVLSVVYNDWGAAEAHQQQYLQAMVHFGEAARWDTSTRGLMRNMGLAAAKVGDNQQAARALQAALKEDPTDKVSRAVLAASLFATAQYADAARSFSMVRDAALADPDMAYAWAFSLSRTNQFKDAKAVLDKLTTLQLTAEMLVLAGQVYDDLGDYGQALSCFQEATRQDPGIKKAYGGAGVALIHLGRPGDAIPELESELKVNPDDPDTQYQLAYAYLQISKNDQAIPLLRSLIAAHPDHARARYQLGKEMLDAGHTAEAIQNLEAAAKLDPSRAYIHYQLQSAYRRAGRTADADRELQLYRQMKDRDRQRITMKTEHRE